MSKEIDSGVSRPPISTVTGISAAEARARATEKDAARFARLKTTVPDRIIGMIEGIPAKYRGLAIKVIAGEGTNASRVKFNCQQCVGWEEVKDRVGRCASRACAFWAVRPYRDHLR